MAESGKSRANENKRIRQEALREQLSQGKHVEHVIDIAKKLTDLGNRLENQQVNRLKIAADIKLRLINKYLPDLKAVEMTNEEESSLVEVLKELAQKLPD